MSHIKEAVSAQSGEDAIYSDLKEGHEQNNKEKKKKSLNFNAQTEIFRHVVPFTESANVHTHTHHFHVL